MTHASQRDVQDRSVTDTFTLHGKARHPAPLSRRRSVRDVFILVIEKWKLNLTHLDGGINQPTQRGRPAAPTITALRATCRDKGVAIFNGHKHRIIARVVTIGRTETIVERYRTGLVRHSLCQRAHGRRTNITANDHRAEHAGRWWEWIDHRAFRRRNLYRTEHPGIHRDIFRQHRA